MTHGIVATARLCCVTPDSVVMARLGYTSRGFKLRVDSAGGCVNGVDVIDHRADRYVTRAAPPSGVFSTMQS